MTRTIWHCHIAVSLDGKIACPDGSFDWLEGYPPQEFGLDAFLAEVDDIVMGRATYETLRGFGEWPHPGKPTFVVTSRPLDLLADGFPPGVEARPADFGALAAELEGRGCRRVWIEGGGRVIRGMMEGGRLDVLEMAVLPLVLGDGITLFPPGTPGLGLRLVKCEPPDGRGAACRLRSRAVESFRLDQNRFPPHSNGEVPRRGGGIMTPSPS
ncbi:MAG: dihydrofolate reductase family protein [Reyranella sp.]|nr:dihydrofolate reductase family protein [Reyranella sp.]